jgi:hypothetical protein
MPDEPSSPSPAPSEDSTNARPEDKEDRSERTKSKTTIIVAACGAGGAVLAAVVAGIFAILSKSPANQPAPLSASSSACSEFPADVDVPSSVGSAATLTFHFSCAPAAGHQYLWVVEADGIGQDKHAEYYPKQFDSAVDAGATVTYILPLQKDTIGEQNCIYVISPTNAQFQTLENSLSPQNFTLQLPDSIDRVSKPACETRQY